MTWYADNSPCGTYGEFRTVGWLSRHKPFTQGDVSKMFFQKLCELLHNAWNPTPTGGFHFCEFCRFTGGPERSLFGDYVVRGQSSPRLYVPGDGYLYVSPTSINHAIDAHGYMPPDAFCEAVLQCPPMRSIAYFKAVLANGGRDLVRLSSTRSRHEP